MKKVCSIILAVMMVVSMIPVWSIAVSAKDHVHVFASEWTTDETAHWHACTADDCGIVDYATCGLEGAAYGTHTIVNGKCKVCDCDCPHKFENDSPVCTLCGKTFYRAYDVNLTGSTLTFKMNVLDVVAEPFQDSNQCVRFDLFLIASDEASGEAFEADYNNGCCTGVYEKGHQGDNGVSNFVKDGETHTITVKLDQLDTLEGFKGIRDLSADKPYFWLNIRPCYTLIGMDTTSDRAPFYNSTMLVTKYVTGEYLVEAPEADDYFFLQKTVFAASLVEGKANGKVTPFVTLMDGKTTLKGASVTFNLGTIADIAGIAGTKLPE